MGVSKFPSVSYGKQSAMGVQNLFLSRGNQHHPIKYIPYPICEVVPFNEFRENIEMYTMRVCSVLDISYPPPEFNDMTDEETYCGVKLKQLSYATKVFLDSIGAFWLSIDRQKMTRYIMHDLYNWMAILIQNKLIGSKDSPLALRTLLNTTQWQWYEYDLHNLPDIMDGPAFHIGDEGIFAESTDEDDEQEN